MTTARRRGRPALAKAKRLDVSVVVRFTPAAAAALGALAKAENRRLSEWLRLLALEALKP